MQTLTAPQGYRPGGVYGICDRCAFKFRLSRLKTEWTGFKVCAECYDPRPRDLDPPRLYAEGLPVRGARPEQPVPLPALSVDLMPAAMTATRLDSGALSVVMTAIPGGGLAPYSFAWDGGGLEVTGGTTASPVFSATATAPQDATYDVSVTITDSAAATVTRSGTIRFIAIAPAPPVNDVTLDLGNSDASGLLYWIGLT